MAQIEDGTFAANGSSAVLVPVSKFTVLAGTDDGTNFGGGTLSVEVSHDGVLYTTADTFTEEGVHTSVSYVGGVFLKLTLAGATSPDLDYSIKYE